MVRSAFPFAVVLGVCLTDQIGLAQPPKPPRPQLINVAERMSKPVKFKFERTPLKEAIEDLKEQLKVPIVLDVKVLEEEAINLEFPISGEGNDRPALESVNGLFLPLGLVAEIRHDVLFVSTIHAQSQWLVSRCYQLKPGNEIDALTKQITSQIGAESWESARGPGKLAAIGPHVLIVFQTLRHHREIERKFAKELLPVIAPADRIADLSPKKGVDPLANMRDLLRRPTSTEYAETPLAEIAADLGKINRIEVDVDHKALEAAAINAKTPVTVNLKGIPLEFSLSLILDQLGLVWTIDGDKILITTPESARRLTVIYDVRDLLAVADGKVLTKGLTRTVQPASWSDVGGPGKISAGDGELSITQTVQVHRMIESWLADVRTALKPGR